MILPSHNYVLLILLIKTLALPQVINTSAIFSSSLCDIFVLLSFIGVSVPPLLSIWLTAGEDTCHLHQLSLLCGIYSPPLHLIIPSLSSRAGYYLSPSIRLSCPSLPRRIHHQHPFTYSFSRNNNYVRTSLNPFGPHVGF